VEFFLFSAKASKKATTTMQDLSEKKLQKSDLVEGNEEKGAGSGTAVESSSQSLAASRDEFFDASQYAFFGRGSSEDVELGGLDEDDGGEQLDDGDDAISNTGDREGVCTCLFFFFFWVKQYAHLHHPTLPFAMPFWL
jgi:hypothetical protein